MADAGELRFKLTADQSSFTSGMAQANNSVKKLGEGVAKTGEHVKGFSLHALASRRNIGVFAAATGSAAGELSHLVHAFEIAPGPIGAAIAAFLLIREALNAQAEAAKKAAEANEENLKSLKRSRLEADNLKVSKAGEQLADSGDRVNKLTQEKLELARPSALGSVKNAVQDYVAAFLGQNLAKERIARLGEIDAALKREQERNASLGLNSQNPLEAKEGKTESHSDTHGVAANQLAVFAVEHQQVNLLQQIAANTERMANAGKNNPLNPNSHFQQSVNTILSFVK